MELRERQNLIARQEALKYKIDFMLASVQHVTGKKHIKMVQEKIDELLDEYNINKRRLENE